MSKVNNNDSGKKNEPTPQQAIFVALAELNKRLSNTEIEATKANANIDILKNYLDVIDKNLKLYDKEIESLEKRLEKLEKGD